MAMETALSPATQRETLPRFVQWSPVLFGALAATAFSSIFLTFGATIGLGVASSAPSWRDASAALAILSGLYLIIQAVISFGIGGYIAGHTRTPDVTATEPHTEHFDGSHGLGAWAVAVVMGALLAALIGSASVGRSNAVRGPIQTSAAEPLLSYELDRLFRAGRRAPTVDLTAERAEAGRILLTTSSHAGMNTDDRSYLIQQVATLTGLAIPDAERRVDSVTAAAKTAIAKSRRSTIILAFSIATAILLGAVAGWAAACVGGRHRDGAPIPIWMGSSYILGRQKPSPQI